MFDAEATPDGVLVRKAIDIVRRISRSPLTVPDFETFYEEYAPYLRRDRLQAQLEVANECGLVKRAYQLVAELDTVKRLIEHREKGRDS